MLLLYGLFKLILPGAFKLLFGCKVTGAEQIPKSGGVIIAANHVSNWDPPVVASYVPRQVHFMAKEELFNIPVFGFVIRRLGAFPVKRGASDRGAIKNAIELLKGGQCLGLFPEGTRSADGRTQKPEPGLALIASKSNAAVVPAAIIGTNRILRGGSFFARLTVRYGKPISMDPNEKDKAALHAFSQRVMDEINALLLAESAESDA